MAKKTKTIKKKKPTKKVEEKNEIIAVSFTKHMPYKPRKIDRLPKNLNDIKKKEWEKY